MNRIDIGSLVRIAGDESGTLHCVRSIAGADFIVTDPEGGLQTLPACELIAVADEDAAASVIEGVPEWKR